MHLQDSSVIANILAVFNSWRSWLTANQYEASRTQHVEFHEVLFTFWMHMCVVVQVPGLEETLQFIELTDKLT